MNRTHKPVTASQVLHELSTTLRNAEINGAPSTIVPATLKNITLKNKRKNCYKAILIFIIILLFFLVPASATTDLSKNSNGSDILNDHKYWFVTDPLKEYFVGDLVNISGTTNAPPSSNLTILVEGSCFMNPAGFPCPRIFELYTITESNISNRNASFFSVQVDTSGREPDVYEVFVWGLESKGNTSVLTLKANVPSIINNQTQNKPSQTVSQPAPTNPYLIIISLGIVSILYLNKNR
jgi:hypothetical protein